MGEVSDVSILGFQFCREEDDVYLGNIYARGSPGEYSDVDIYSGYCAALSILDKSGRISQNPRHLPLTKKL